MVYEKSSLQFQNMKLNLKALMKIKCFCLKIIWYLHFFALCSSRHRSSLSQMFFKICVLKNFLNFAGKHQCWSFFLIKLKDFGPATLSKKRLQQMCFPVKFAKFFETLVFTSSFSCRYSIWCICYPATSTC